MSVRWAFDCSKWTPTATEWTLGMNLLQLEERQRIRKFRYQSDAKAALIARLMLKKFAKEQVKLSCSSERLFDRSNHGRPRFIDSSINRLWDFNLSHQGNFVVFAAEKASDAELICNKDEYERSVKVGIDVMRFRDENGPLQKDIPRFFKLMSRQFTSEEWEFIMSSSSSTVDQISQLLNFYRMWCLKESFVKASGTGLTINLQRLSFKCSSPLSKNPVIDTTLYLDRRKVEEWTFEEFLLDSDHVVCTTVSRKYNERPLPEFCYFNDFCQVSGDNVVNRFEDGREEWRHFHNCQEKLKPF